MQTPGFQMALFKGFLNIPHIPLPPEHSMGTSEATIVPTPEIPRSWHNRQRPREMEMALDRPPPTAVLPMLCAVGSWQVVFGSGQSPLLIGAALSVGYCTA